MKIAGKPLLLAGIVFDITNQKSLEAELERLARMDDLTQIMNRRTIFEFLENEIKRSLRDHHKFSVIMMDIDHFKKVNDNYGHVLGDQVLIEVAGLMGEEIREIDGLGRYGGEEFLVVLSGTESSEAFQVAERIRNRIAGHVFASGIRVTISAGLSIYHGQDIHKLVSQADENLYRAKEGGRNCVNC